MYRVYIETTIPSYLVSKPNRDIIVLTHQEITKIWWETQKSNYELYISEYVIQEIIRGDSSLSKKRVEILNDMTILEHNNFIENLVRTYLENLKFPVKAIIDLFHIACSVYYEMDYLLTWNCKHLANAHFKSKLLKFNNTSGLKTPEICTPEQLIMEV
ncbi:MAG: type II toxin-antitoxin system VapC family toxin [Candidatus Eremiobacterota bacterium]